MRCVICDFSRDTPSSDYFRGLKLSSIPRTISIDYDGKPKCSLCLAATWVDAKAEDENIVPVIDEGFDSEF